MMRLLPSPESCPIEKKLLNCDKTIQNINDLLNIPPSLAQLDLFDWLGESVMWLTPNMIVCIQYFYMHVTLCSLDDETLACSPFPSGLTLNACGFKIEIHCSQILLVYYETLKTNVWHTGSEKPEQSAILCLIWLLKGSVTSETIFYFDC